MDDQTQQAFDEIVRQNADLAAVGVGQRAREPRRRRRRPPWRWASLPLTVTVLVLVLVVAGSGVWRQVLPAPAAPQGEGVSGPYVFSATSADGHPVGYDSCRPIHYVVNPTGSPRDGAAIIAEAVAEVSAATGLTFVDDGVVDEPVVVDRAQIGSEETGWAPVLIGWTGQDAVPELAGDGLGFGGSLSLAPSGPGTDRFVTGAIALDAADMADLLDGPQGRALGRAVVMHELGHVVGLGHVDDPDEVMYASTSDQLVWGPGDLEGLAAVGAAPCW